MSAAMMTDTAAAMVARGKGILAIDESMPTIKKRFDGIGIESTEANRRAYRELLIDNPAGAEYVSGMILFDETIRQSTAAGVAFTEVLASQGVMAGIKVDAGAKPMALSPGEKVTEGLDGLRDRLAEYRDLGARFAKWRAVITIDEALPTSGCINANAQALARYAALCQETGLVPMVEPEVLMDWSNDIDRCFDVTSATLRALFAALADQRVSLETTVLKTNMVVSGKQCPTQAGVDEVAEKTVRCLRQTVPAATAGVVFLSGGQSAVDATAHLNAMNDGYAAQLPWPLSFSFGRALQEPALKAWRGNASNTARARELLLHRERCNSLAARGEYTPELDKAA